MATKKKYGVVIDTIDILRIVALSPAGNNLTRRTFSEGIIKFLLSLLDDEIIDSKEFIDLYGELHSLWAAYIDGYRDIKTMGG